jgi:hypothetical protein
MKGLVEITRMSPASAGAADDVALRVGEEADYEPAMRIHEFGTAQDALIEKQGMGQQVSPQVRTRASPRAPSEDPVRNDPDHGRAGNRIEPSMLRLRFQLRHSRWSNSADTCPTVITSTH